LGDGSTKTGATVTHAYATPGAYNATLRVTDNLGASTTDVAAVTVLNRAPTANAGADQSGVAGTAVTFSGTGSSDTDGTLTSYSWAFGDGGSASGATASHVYTTAGTYTVTLTVTDNLGATGTDTAVVTVSGAGSTQWVRSLGGSGEDAAAAVAVDASGNVVVVGTFAGTLTVGTQTLVSAGGLDVFVAKYTAAGSLVWAKRWGGASDDFARGVKVTGTGDLIVVGYFYGTADFGTGALVSAGLADIVLASYSGTTGAARWVRRVGNTADDVAYAVAVDTAGNAYVTGGFAGTVDFGSGPVTAISTSQADTFVAKLAVSTGACAWARQFLNGSTDIGYGIGVDGSGNVLLTGAFAYRIDFGGGILETAGGQDVFVAKLLGTTGAYVWAQRYGGTGTDLPQALAVDAGGNAVVTGYFQGTVNFGTGALTAQGWDGFVAKYGSATGAAQWSRRFGALNPDYGYGVAVDGSGNPVVTGLFHDTVDFGTGAVSSAGMADIMVVRYAATTGATTSTRRYGGTGFDYATAIAVAPSGALVTAGVYRNTVNFGTGPVTVTGGADAFLLSLNP
jgi:chitodextrinase